MEKMSHKPTKLSCSSPNPPLLRIVLKTVDVPETPTSPPIPVHKKIMFLKIAIYIAITTALIAVYLLIPPASKLISTFGTVAVISYASYVFTNFLYSRLNKRYLPSSNKAVLITGCDSGFGNELARRLCDDGIYVYASCLFPDSEDAKNLASDCKGKLRILKIDVTKDEDVKAAVKEIDNSLEEKEFWGVVCNAGRSVLSEIEWCDVETFQEMIDVNVLGNVRITKAFLPLLRKSRGRVILVASVAGHFTYPGFVGYSMSKHAIISFADGLRREMRKWGVTVVTIEPGLYRTRMTTEDAVNSGLEKNWQKTPDIVKESYGQDYFEAFRKSLLKAQQAARTNIFEVVEKLQEALLAENPDDTYRCAGIKDHIRYWFMSNLPTPIMDFLFCLVLQPNKALVKKSN